MIKLEISFSKGYLSNAIGAVFDRKYYFDPIRRHKVDKVCHQYIKTEFPNIDAFYTESNLGRLRYHDPKQVLIGGIQPNMILGMLLGATFIAHEKMDADISKTCWIGRDTNELPAPESLLEHEMINLFDRQIINLKNHSDMIPIPPFFWDSSGRAAIHGPITTAQKFIGEGIFLDMVTNPHSLKKVVDWITESYIVMVRHFAELAEIELKSLHVGECSSCMIGPQQFTEFVVPALNRLGAQLGPIRLHSCGQSNHIIEACKNNIDRLCSLDLGGETSLARVRGLFCSEFPISIAPVVMDILDDTPDALLGWLNRVVEDNAGGELTILCHVEPDYNLKNLRALHTELQNY